MNKNIDEIDDKIFKILHCDGRISLTELGKKVHLTSQAVKNRLEKLSDLGIVQKYTVNVNCPIYGYPIHALIKIFTADKTFFKKFFIFIPPKLFLKV